MTHSVRNGLFGLMMVTMPLVACAQQPGGAAPTTLAVAPANPAQAPAPQLVVGLPDFTQLVEQVGPGVVNIEAKVNPRAATSARSQMPDDEEIPEFFRRFFGPGVPMPGTPDPGSRGARSVGSGFIISSDGYVLTNHHVISGADEVKVKLADRREFNAKVVGSDEQYDVALLKIDATGLPTVRLGDSKTLKPGQWAVAIGSPFGLDHSVTAGIVSATGRSNPYADQRYVPFIQTDVAINQGNSGGPLLNTRGEVVGINSQIFSASGGYMGISFAIPIDLAMGAVEQIKKTGRVSRGQLGVLVGAIDANTAEGFKLPDTRGALVNEVLGGSAAAKAGLEVGDVIRSVNGVDINASSDLPPQIGALAPGSKVKLGVLRDGRLREMNVTLTELDADAQSAGQARPAAERPAASVPAANRLLGIAVADMNEAVRKPLGLKPGEGVRIVSVDTPAAREARLMPGGVILQVGRTPVGSVAELEKQLRDVKTGDVVMLLVRYRDATSFVAVKAG